VKQFVCVRVCVCVCVRVSRKWKSEISSNAFAINFCVKLGETGIEAFNKLKQDYGEHALSRSQVFKCTVVYYFMAELSQFGHEIVQCATDLENLYRTHDKHQWLLLQFIVLLLMDANDVRNM